MVALTGVNAHRRGRATRTMASPEARAAMLSPGGLPGLLPRQAGGGAGVAAVPDAPVVPPMLPSAAGAGGSPGAAGCPGAACGTSASSAAPLLPLPPPPPPPLPPPAAVPSSTRTQQPGVWEVICSLTASDANWRNKVLKVVQYAARLVVWLHGHTPRSAVVARILAALLPAAARCREVAKSLSLARRVQVWGDGALAARRTVLLARDAVTGVAAPTGGALLQAAIDGAAGVLDDVQTATKVSLLDAAALPAAFPRAVNVSWAVQCATSMQAAVAKAAAVAAAAPAGGAAAPAAAAAKWAADMHAARLNVIKCAADVVQSAPAALDLGWWPEVVEICAGLASGVISVARIWHAATSPK